MSSEGVEATLSDGAALTIHRQTRSRVIEPAQGVVRMTDIHESSPSGGATLVSFMPVTRAITRHLDLVSLVSPSSLTRISR